MNVRKLYTLIFVKRNSEVLLGYKKRGLGAGLWNGFGGKVEKNETVMEGAVRELKEESNLDAELSHIGVVTYFVESKRTKEVVHIFTSRKFHSEIIESEEMAPIKWFNHMPYDKMWPDAPSWIPLMLDERLFAVDVIYSCDSQLERISKKLFENRDDFEQHVKEC